MYATYKTLHLSMDSIRINAFLSFSSEKCDLQYNMFEPCTSDAKPHHFDADPDSTFHPDADLEPEPDPSFQIKAQTLEKVLK